MSVTDFNAAKKWAKIPKEVQKKLVNSAFCTSCLGVTTIVDYNIKNDPMGIILDGKCIRCRYKVVRFIED